MFILQFKFNKFRNSGFKKFFSFIYLFIFGCIGSSLLRAGFLQLQRAGATLRCGVRASHCGGFSCCGARALGAWASIVVSHGLSSCDSQALEHRPSSCGTWAQLLCSMWDLLGPGLEPMSLALVGGFLTTAPPGKPRKSGLLLNQIPLTCESFFLMTKIPVFNDIIIIIHSLCPVQHTQGNSASSQKYDY